MIIQSRGNLYGLGDKFHLRQTQDGLRVDGTTIVTDDPAAAYEKVKTAATKGAPFVDLDPKPAKKAPAKKPTAEQQAEAPAEAPEPEK